MILLGYFFIVLSVTLSENFTKRYRENPAFIRCAQLFIGFITFFILSVEYIHKGILFFLSALYKIEAINTITLLLFLYLQDLTVYRFLKKTDKKTDKAIVTFFCNLWVGGEIGGMTYQGCKKGIIDKFST